jgi:hypothetical protein
MTAAWGQGAVRKAVLPHLPHYVISSHHWLSLVLVNWTILRAAATLATRSNATYMSAHQRLAYLGARLARSIPTAVLNAGEPHVVEAVRTLSDIVARVQAHRQKTRWLWRELWCSTD